ncbi:hypothetical protein [Tahibacter amnicola]|uniref:Peptidase YpeB-like protein n=1 Tax=Tahibacter amnicola TaxID=2976241 RepID=A0ABY6B741_9GAMM|nr:hypothetical protein [Tahibacter amnicola]UXI65916.1 hypothetical protein N4264_14240 [Tahibacter amnicola]
MPSSLWSIVMLLAMPVVGAQAAHLHEFGKVLNSEEIAAYSAASDARLAMQGAGGVRAVSFPASTYLHLLSQPKAAGIVAHYVVNPATGRDTLMLQAVDGIGQAFGDSIDNGLPCPPYCPKQDVATTNNKSPLIAPTAEELQSAGKVLSADEVQQYFAAGARKSARVGRSATVSSASFPAWTYVRLLSQPGAAGLSVHYTLDPKSGKDTLLLRAIDKDGSAFGESVNFSNPCPPC